jgi:hypothetical protein
MTRSESHREAFLRSRTGRVALLAALLLDLFVIPLLMALRIVPQRVGDIVFAVLMAAAAFAIGRGSARRWVLGLVTVAFLAQFLQFFGTGRPGAIIDAGLSAVALAVFAGLVLADTLRSDPIADRLLDVVLVYVLIGGAYALVYEIVDLASPGALSLPPERRNDFEYVYFSITTLTSVGSGNVVPVSAVARLMVMLESLTGQLYVAVLIARFANLAQGAPSRAGRPG